MRIALAQINPTVGDVSGNTRMILDAIARAQQGGAQLAVFPEMSILGYPPLDLLLKPDLIEACGAALHRILEATKSIDVIVGLPRRSESARGRPILNSAAFCHAGKVIHWHDKQLLPTYDVFNEARYFEPGAPDDPISLPGSGIKLGVTVCEDLWNDENLFPRPLYHDNPIELHAQRGADLFLNISASPFVLGKQALRLSLLTHTAKRYGLPIVYVNQVGGNDELVFDGNSCVVGADGRLLAHAKDFEEDLLFADLPVGTASRKPQAASRLEQPRDAVASIHAALVLGLRDYCRKCGFKAVVLGLSGGIDSALAACIAADALGPANVTGVAMPSRYSSPGSVSDAEQLARNLGIAFHVVPIEAPHAAMESTLAPLFAGREPDLAEENVQARLRAVVLMGLSNKFGSMLVTTGNKSELAVGYCTLYGDMAGGLAVLSDVPKTVVYQLAEWINTHKGNPIPRDTITKPPSAELRPNQTDQDTLPPYETLDEIIERYVEREQPVRTIVKEAGLDEAVVSRIVALIDRNEYKRKQMPPGIKVTGRAFGSGRKMPIAQRWPGG